MAYMYLYTTIFTHENDVRNSKVVRRSAKKKASPSPHWKRNACHKIGHVLSCPYRLQFLRNNRLPAVHTGRRTQEICSR